MNEDMETLLGCALPTTTLLGLLICHRDFIDRPYSACLHRGGPLRRLKRAEIVRHEVVVVLHVDVGDLVFELGRGSPGVTTCVSLRSKWSFACVRFIVELGSCFVIAEPVPAIWAVQGVTDVGSGYG